MTVHVRASFTPTTTSYPKISMELRFMKAFSAFNFLQDPTPPGYDTRHPNLHSLTLISRTSAYQCQRKCELPKY
jgi:hypothetical protein